jgi:lia operon protein LiaG
MFPLPSRGIAATALLLVAPHSAAGQLLERQTLEGARVSVHNLVGELRVVPTPGSRAEVAVARSGADAEDLRVEIRREEEWDAVRIHYPDSRVVYGPMGRWSRSEWDIDGDRSFADLVPRGSRRITIAGSGSGVRAQADITVHLPAGGRLSVHQAVGSVELENVEGEFQVRVRTASVEARRIDGPLTVDARSGPVRVEEVRGDLRAEVRSGSVEASGVRGDLVRLASRSGSVAATDLTFERAELEARSGRVRVVGARGGRLAVHSRSGGIEGDDVEVGEVVLDARSGSIGIRRLAAGTLRAESRSGSVDLELVGQTASGWIQSRSGRITLVVPQGFGAELDVETRGSIRVDAPASAWEQTRDRFRGRLGEGGGPLEIRARSGGVRIQGG